MSSSTEAGAVALAAYAFEPLPELVRAVPQTALDPVAAAQEQHAASAIVAAAEQEAIAIREQAYAAGHEEGRLAGMAAAAAELEPAAAALGEALVLAREGTLARAAEVERRAAELAVGVAEKIVVQAIAVDPERVLDVVSAALRVLVERERVTLLVNPADLELVRGSVATLTATLGGIGHLEVQAERRIARGGAIVRTAQGEIDATLRGKLDRAREVLLERPA